MAWTKVQELQIASYTRLVVTGQKTIDDVPEVLKVEVQYRVEKIYLQQLKKFRKKFSTLQYKKIIIT